MGVQVYEQILKGCSTRRPVQKLVLLALASHADDQGWVAGATLTLLAFYAGCSKDAARATLKQLEEQAWLVLSRRATNSRPALYHLNVDRVLRRGEYA